MVEEGAIIALPGGTAHFEPLGRFELKGIPDPVGLWLATAPECRLAREPPMPSECVEGSG